MVSWEVVIDVRVDISWVDINLVAVVLSDSWVFISPVGVCLVSRYSVVWTVVDTVSSSTTKFSYFSIYGSFRSRCISHLSMFGGMSCRNFNRSTERCRRCSFCTSFRSINPSCGTLLLVVTFSGDVYLVSTTTSIPLMQYRQFQVIAALEVPIDDWVVFYESSLVLAYILLLLQQIEKYQSMAAQFWVLQLV